MGCLTARANKGTGGWQVANDAGGANVNRLMSSAREDLEKLAGMAWLTGVPGAGRPCVNQIRCATSALTAWLRKSGAISGHSGRH